MYVPRKRRLRTISRKEKKESKSRVYYCFRESRSGIHSRNDIRNVIVAYRNSMAVVYEGTFPSYFLLLQSHPLLINVFAFLAQKVLMYRQEKDSRYGIYPYNNINV